MYVRNKLLITRGRVDIIDRNYMISINKLKHIKKRLIYLLIHMHVLKNFKIVN